MSSEVGHLGIPRAISALTVTVAGLCAGSFLSALAYRLPRGLNVLWGRSVCPHCGHALGARDLVPLLSYAAHRGRCRFCRSPIDATYPALEGICGLGFLATWYLSPDPVSWVSRVALLCLLLVLAITDLRHGVLPNQLTLGGLALGLVFSATGWTIPMTQSVLGAAVGAAVILVIVLLSRGGMGVGDAKMLAMIGAFLGPWGALGTLLWASFVGSVVGVGLLLTGRATRKTKLPFGPFLAVGAVLAELTVPLWLRFMGLG